MRRRVSNNRMPSMAVVRKYVPDLARQAQALLAVLHAHEAPPCPDTPAPAAPPAGPTRSNAPAVGTTGASTNTGTVTSSAINKQGCTDDTTTRP